MYMRTDGRMRRVSSRGGGRGLDEEVRQAIQRCEIKRASLGSEEKRRDQQYIEHMHLRGITHELELMRVLEALRLEQGETIVFIMILIFLVFLFFPSPFSFSFSLFF